MVQGCAFSQCGNAGTLRFPKDQKYINLWLQKINKKNWKPSVYSRVCFDHFLPQDFLSNLEPNYSEGRKRLRKEAVPSVFKSSKGHASCSSIVSDCGSSLALEKEFDDSTRAPRIALGEDEPFSPPTSSPELSTKGDLLRTALLVDIVEENDVLCSYPAIKHSVDKKSAIEHFLEIVLNDENDRLRDRVNKEHSYTVNEGHSSSTADDNTDVEDCQYHFLCGLTSTNWEELPAVEVMKEHSYSAPFIDLTGDDDPPPPLFQHRFSSGSYEDCKSGYEIPYHFWQREEEVEEDTLPASPNIPIYRIENTMKKSTQDKPTLCIKNRMRKTTKRIPIVPIVPIEKVIPGLKNLSSLQLQRITFIISNEVFRKVNMFSCNYCKSQYETKDMLEQHLRMHMRFPCRFCGNRYPTGIMLQRHLGVHMLQRYICQYCTRRFQAKSALEQHIGDEHCIRKYTPSSHFDFAFEVGRLFVCNYCKMDFKTKPSLVQHMTVHFTCSICKTILPSKQMLEDHLYTHGRFTCELCKKLFNTKYMFEQHMGTHLTYTCEHCKKLFKSKYMLEQHMSSHKRVCDYCRKGFSFQRLLDLHMKIHQRKCTDCNKKFNSQKTLNQHMRLHKRSCSVCKIELSAHLLERHLRIHKIYTCSVCQVQYKSDTKLYTAQSKCKDCADLSISVNKCIYCRKRYDTKRKLKKHIKRIHLRPYPCDFCEEKFTTGEAIKEHSVIHAGDRHTCQYCPKQFRMKRSLIRHIKIMHINHFTVQSVRNSLP